MNFVKKHKVLLIIVAIIAVVVYMGRKMAKADKTTDSGSTNSTSSGSKEADIKNGADKVVDGVQQLVNATKKGG